jgi:hypothetical protein
MAGWFSSNLDAFVARVTTKRTARAWLYREQPREKFKKAFRGHRGSQPRADLKRHIHHVACAAPLRGGGVELLK